MNESTDAQLSKTVKLKVQGLTKIYGGRPNEALQMLAAGATPREILSGTQQVVAVSNVSFSVEQGEIFTIMGLSGSGKSTLVRCLNRLIEPSAGSVLVDGQNLMACSGAQLQSVRRSKIAMVFQNFALLPHKSVVENVEFGLMLRGELLPNRRKKALLALDQVGLAEWAQRYPDNLSGGMKQRVGLARALASDPDILLMDEPFSALDPLIRSDLQQELLRLQREIRKTIIFITHDFHEAVRISDRLAVMRDGAFVQVGGSHDIVLRPTDDYVATFARELDRSQLLRAGDVSHARVPIVSEDTPTGTVRNQLMAAGTPHAVVVDADRIPLGFVRVQNIAAMGIDQHASRIANMRLEGVESALSSTPLSQLYPLLGEQAPVVVSDSFGKALGAIDASDVLQHLYLVVELGRSSSPGRGSRGLPPTRREW